MKVYLIISLLMVLQTFEYTPIVGIYGNSNPESNINKFDADFVDQEYVKWLQSAGIEVIAIHEWQSKKELQSILGKINGVLFQGGDRDLTRGAIWEQKASYIVEYCIENQLPIWATCQGFQLIGFLLSENDNVLDRYKGDWGKIHGASLTQDGKDSRMFKYFTEKDFEMYKEDTQIYFHNLGLGMENYNKSNRLKELIKVTSVAFDKDGKEFISSYEGRSDKIKIFGTQYHPEKIYYMRELGTDNLIPNYNCFKIAYKLLLGFADEVHLNNNKMSAEERKNYDFIINIGLTEGVSSKLNFRSYFYQNKKNDPYNIKHKQDVEGIDLKTLLIIILSVSVLILSVIIFFILYKKQPKRTTKPGQGLEMEEMNQV